MTSCDKEDFKTAIQLAIRQVLLVLSYITSIVEHEQVEQKFENDFPQARLLTLDCASRK